MLHRDLKCRDIAIWYDEFLTPGENFNDSIQAALEKSGLFVLAVTPNLVNEDNYIRRVEYPLAQQANKPVLPAEMVETDAYLLRSMYPDIPEKLDPRDERFLTDAVLSRIGALAKEENDQDPRHNFFIGLAYLTGIDVEVNFERAVALITGAAEAGLPEAMEKLVAMYENGEGVQRDYMEAIRWRQRRTEQARVQYEETGSATDADTYFSQLWDLGDAWRAVADLTAAMQVYRQMLALAQARQAAAPSNRNRRNVSVCYDKLGLLCLKEGKLPEAKVWYQKGLELAEALAETGTVQARRDLSISYENLGDLCRLEGNVPEAKVWYQKGLELAEALAETGTVQARRDLSVSYEKLGDLCQQENNLQEAKVWFQKDLELAEAMAETGTVEVLDDLACSCYFLGSLDEDRKLLRRALQLWEQLATQCPQVPRYAQNAGIVRRELAELDPPPAPQDDIMKQLAALVAQNKKQDE